MEKEHGRCAYCRSLEMFKDASICRSCYEKLLLIRKIKAIGQMIKEQAATEKHGGEHRNDISGSVPLE